MGQMLEFRTPEMVVVLPTSSKGQKLSGGKLSEASLAIKQTRRG
jgi:hypothetical protein